MRHHRNQPTNEPYQQAEQAVYQDPYAMTPDQMAAYQAQMQGMTPDQMTAYQAQMQGMTPDQMAAYQAQMQGMTPDQMAAYQAQMQGMTPDQMAAYQAQYGMAADPMAGYQAETPDRTAANLQWQAAQLGMTPEQLLQWQAMQKAKENVRAKKERKKRKKERRRERHAQHRFLYIACAVVLVAGIGALAYTLLRGTQATTAVIELGTLGTSYRGDALIVRDETIYDDESVQTIEYVAEEGSVVYRGDVVCYVYSTGYSSSELTTLQSYRDQIKDYQQTLLSSESAYDQKMDRLETQVIDRGLEVRSLVQGARGNLINQEGILDTAITQRQNYFRSKYSTDARLSRLYDDEETQQQRIDSWIKQRASTQESIVSFYTDGFEYALTPDKYGNYTPAQVRRMFNGERLETTASTRGKTTIYRLVKQNNYVVLLLIKDSTWNPVEGTTYKLMLEQFSNTTVNAQVLSYTRSGGELLVRLAVMGDVTPVLYMRTCEAELGEYVDCLLVPPSAIYTQNDQKGVVLIQNDGSQVFVPVTIMSETATQTYVSAIQTGVLNAGQTVRLFH